MNHRRYITKTCPLCNCDISTNGAAQASHKRRHVKEGLMYTEEDVYYDTLKPYTRFYLTDAGEQRVRELAEAGKGE